MKVREFLKEIDIRCPVICRSRLAGSGEIHVVGGSISRILKIAGDYDIISIRSSDDFIIILVKFEFNE